MADFIFRVSSVKLNHKQQAQIATAIQGAVLTELGKLDLGPSSTPDCLFRPPIGWYGGLLISVDNAPIVANTTLTVTETKT
jgi:hypothetical protein